MGHKKGRARVAAVIGSVFAMATGALALAAPAHAGAPARAAEVHDCHHWVKYPNTMISSARNMSCRVARGEMRRYRGSIRFRFTTPHRHFRCQRVSGGELGGQWRCARGGKAFRFDFGD